MTSAGPRSARNVRWGITNNLTLTGHLPAGFRRGRVRCHEDHHSIRATRSPIRRSGHSSSTGSSCSTRPTISFTLAQIEAPLDAVKLTGKVGDWSVAYLGAQDEEDSSLTGRRALDVQHPPGAARSRERRRSFGVTIDRQGAGRRVQPDGQRGRALHLRQDLLGAVAGRCEQDARQRRDRVGGRAALVRSIHPRGSDVWVRLPLPRHRSRILCRERVHREERGRGRQLRPPCDVLCAARRARRDLWW